LRSGHISADHRQLDQPLGEVGERLRGELALEAGHRRDLGEFRRQRLERPDQPMLDQVAGERRQHQHQERNGHRRHQLAADLLEQARQSRPVHADFMRIGKKPAHGRGEVLARAAGKAHQHQRRGGHHEPGVDLLALDHVAALERVVEALL
jgi:hypothetical protein